VVPGRWTGEEHILFLKGLEMHGKGWKKIAKLIKTRTVVQIRTHAQKYFQKLAKAKKNGHHGDLLLENSRFGKRVRGGPALMVRAALVSSSRA
jgi:SHAQKYF class myb-like DNA-binding protein